MLLLEYNRLVGFILDQKDVVPMRHVYEGLYRFF